MQRTVASDFRVGVEQADAMDTETCRLVGEAILGLYDDHSHMLFEKGEIDKDALKDRLEAVWRNYQFIQDEDIDLSDKLQLNKMKFGGIRQALALGTVADLSTARQVEILKPTDLYDELGILERFASIRNTVIDLYEAGDLDETTAKCIIYFFEGEDSDSNTKDSKEVIISAAKSTLKGGCKSLDFSFDSSSHPLGESISRGTRYISLMIAKRDSRLSIESIAKKKHQNNLGIELGVIERVIKSRIAIALAAMYSKNLDKDSMINYREIDGITSDVRKINPSHDDETEVA